MKVYPAIEAALKVKHPHGVGMTQDGADWPDDPFTWTLVHQGDLTKDSEKAWKKAAVAVAPLASKDRG